MRPHGVGVLSPPFDEDLGLPEGVEDLLQDLVPELPNEGVTVTVLPGAPRLDEQGTHLKPAREPLPDDRGAELGAVVGPEMAREALRDEQLREGRRTSSAVSARATTIANASRVNSSTIVSSGKARPSWVRSVMMS